MKSKDADSLQIVANILGNISAIAAGIAIFETGALGIRNHSCDCLCSHGCIYCKRHKMNYLLVLGFGLALFAYGQYIIWRNRN